MTNTIRAIIAKTAWDIVCLADSAAQPVAVFGGDYNCSMVEWRAVIDAMASTRPTRRREQLVKSRVIEEEGRKHLHGDDALAFNCLALQENSRYGNNFREKGVTNNGFSDAHDLVLVPILFDNISMARSKSGVASPVGRLPESRKRVWESAPKEFEESMSTEPMPVHRAPGIAMNSLDSARVGLKRSSHSSGTAPLPLPSPSSATPRQPQPQTGRLQQPPPEAQSSSWVPLGSVLEPSWFPQPPPEPQPAPQPHPQAHPAPGLETPPRNEKAPHVNPEEGGIEGEIIGGGPRLEEEQEEAEEVEWEDDQEEGDLQSWAQFSHAASKVVDKHPELAKALEDIAGKFLFENSKFNQVIHVEGHGYQKLASTFAASPGPKWEHLLKMTRDRYEIAVRDRRGGSVAQPSDLSDQEMRDLMNAWRNDYCSWSRNVAKIEELEGMAARKMKGSAQDVHQYLKQTFSTFLMELCGCKPLVSALIKSPLHMSSDPATWCKAFLEAHDEYLQSEQRDKAVKASEKKSKTQEMLKRRAHALRQKLLRAKNLYNKVLRQSDVWHHLGESDQDLYWQYHRGILEQEVLRANND